MRAPATCAAAVLLTLALRGGAADIPSPGASGASAWLTEPDMRAALVRLWRASGEGRLPIEIAAWVVARDGASELVPWTGAAGSHYATWRGPLPGGAIALVHTHPQTDDPRPSSHDVATAREIRLPIMVVTRSGLWTASPGGIVARDADASWTRELPGRSRP